MRACHKVMLTPLDKEAVAYIEINNSWFDEKIDNFHLGRVI